MLYNDTTVIIPTLNEEKTIGKLIGMLVEKYPQISVMVSDDGSSDATQQVVRELNGKNNRILLLDRSKAKNHGLTVSVIDAIRKTGTDFFVVMDGDMQHPPEKVGALIESLRNGADVAAGKRVKIVGYFPLHRRIISSGGMLLGKVRLILARKKCTDIMSGFFGGNTVFVKKVIEPNYGKFELGGYKALFDLLKVLPSTAKVSEVDYCFGGRHAGHSKMNKWHIIAYFKSLFK